MKQKKIPKKIEFTTTTIEIRDVWGELVLAVIIPKKQKSSYASFGGDIVNVTIKPSPEKRMS